VASEPVVTALENPAEDADAAKSVSLPWAGAESG